ncbi:MAG: methyl-accepting chemotaxis protein [Phaeospirillum sp.]|nr:methyl-accepting chemotaxis protein [Phaeospirillum sp.]
MAKGLTVKNRIYGGFFLVLLFLMALAGMSFWGSKKTDHAVNVYQSVAANAQRVLTIERNVAGMRRNTREFVFTGEEKSAQRSRELQGLLKKDIAEVVAATADPGRKANLETMQKLFESYQANFATLIDLRHKRDRLVNEGMNPIGAKADKMISDLVETAQTRKEWELASEIGQVQEGLMRMRVAALRFLTTPDKAGAEEVKTLRVAMNRDISHVLPLVKDPQLRKAVEEATDLAIKYEAAFQEAAVAVLERNHLANDVMSAQAAEFGDLATKTRLSQAAYLDQMDKELTADLAAQEMSNIIISVIAILLGLTFAILIARSILTPIAAMTGAMGLLADGKLDTQVPALDRHDEIGEMAKAVQVFKQNGIDKVRMEAEQRAAEEAARQAEEEQRKREAAIVAEVAEVAKAASSGDLDRRIDLEGKSGFLLNLCEGVNNLVHLTGIALKDVAGVLGAVAQGDLTRRITADYAGVFGQLKGDVNLTADKLFEVVSNINEATGQITGASGEVAAGSQDLSERSEQQASALEETAASMEELSATVRQNAANAQQANQLAAGAREVAAGGGQVVSDAIAAMSRIEGSSQKIEDIVGMIDEIAFQTNLLALNAAVEAARAGDAGKGFAVVAQEVRNLAQRSAQASKEIKGLIAESSTQVRTGADLVKGAGRTLEEILGSVKRVADIVAEIAAASAEQASGIDQVNQAITQMDEMTQQNAALVEESTAAAHSLEDQARHLGEVMAFFHTGDEGKAAAPTGRPAPKPAAKAQTKPAARPPVKKPQAASHLAKLHQKADTAGSAATPSPSAAKTNTAGEDWAEF